MTHTASNLQGLDRLTTAIRNVFAVEGDLSSSDVERLHAQLIEYVNDCNARLKHCDDLLRRGLRQEALQECEDEPNLLDLATRLDFPEWDAWADYVSQFSLAPQPLLLLDVAAELNEAYSKAQSLDGLLRMHRLHSLARSPLQVRIGVLRSIVAKDPQNPAWRTDLEAFEGARLKQLRVEFTEQNSQDNLAGIASLHREIENASWIVKPPAALLEEVAGGHRRLVAKAARERLKTLEPTINDAFSAFDLSAAQVARQQWDELWPLADLEDADQLAMRVRPAFSWLDEERAMEHRQVEHKRAIASLDDALDNVSSTRHELTRLYDAIERHEEPIPERTQRRYDERLRSLETAEHRKHRLLLISGFVAVTMIAAVIGVFTFRQARKADAIATAEAMQKLLEEGKSEQAIDFYESRISAKPHLASAPQIEVLHNKAKSQLSDELSRRERLTSLLEEAEHLAATITWESVASANNIIKQAKEIVRGEEEQMRLLVAERAVAQTADVLQKKVDSDFAQDVAALSDQMNGSTPLSYDALQTLLKEARELNARQRVSTTAKHAAGIDILTRKLEDQAKSLTEARRRDEALRVVVAAIGSVPAYKRALNAYLIADATSARATDFHNVIAEDLGELERLGDWNELADQWNELRLSSPQDAARALEMLISLQKNFASYPGVSGAVSSKPYLESIKARRKSDDATLLDDLRNILKEDLFNMRQIRNPRGEGYIYCLASPTESGGKVTVTALLDSRDPKQSVTKSYGIDEYNNANPPTVSRDTPQKAFAEDANAILSDANAPFELVVCKILHRLLTDAQMDPVLKCRLLQVFYDRSAPGSSILTEELRGFRTGIESTYALEDVNFIADVSLSKDDAHAADAEHAAIVRTNTEELLRRSPLPKGTSNAPPSIASAYVERIRPRVDKFNNGSMRLPRFRWRAGLFKTADGQWILRTEDAVGDAPRGELAIFRRGGDGEPSFEIVGTTEGNVTRLQQRGSSQFREGKPVLCIEGAQQ